MAVLSQKVVPRISRLVASAAIAGLIAVGIVVASPHTPTAVAAPGAVCVPAGTGTAALNPSGVFVAPNQMINSASQPFTAQQWSESMASYRAAGVSNVIVQYVAKVITADGKWGAWFPNVDEHGPIYTPGTDGSVDSTYTDVLRRILEAAQQNGMTVTVGLGLDESGWFRSSPDVGWQSPAWLREQAARATRAATVIWDTYGDQYADTIDGWYLPYESEGYQLASATGAPTPEVLDPYITEYAKPVSEAVHQLSGRSKVMVSPLFTARTGDPDSAVEKGRLAAWTTAWAKVFAETEVTVLAPQDGAGSGKNTTTDIMRWFAATAAARDQSGSGDAQVWGNAEIYRDQNASVGNMGVNQISQNLAAMRAGGATGMIMFSALSLEHLPGHGTPTSMERRAGFYAAFARWAGGDCSPSSALSAPADVAAATGSGEGADPAAAVNAATTVRVAWDPSISSAPVDRRDMQVAGYQVVRDGRVVAEYGPTKAGIAVEHVDHQLQPGRTYTYQVYGFDAWGTFTLKPATVNVTIPWSGAALEARDGEAGTFNVARNAPTAVTNNPDGVSIGGAGLGAVAAGSELIPSATYGDEVTDPGAIGTPTGTSDFAAGPATDGLLGTDSAVDGRWQGQYSPTTHNWGITLRLAEPDSDGVTLRQLNTQWLRDKSSTVYLPQTVAAVAIGIDGTRTDLGVRSSRDVTGAAPGDAIGQFWFNLTATSELTGIASIELTIKSAVSGWLFLGQLQAFDSAGTNHALGAPYALTRYNTLDYSDGTTSYPGSRAWSLTDGITAPDRGHTDPAWAARWMGSKTYAPSNGTDAYLTLDLGATQTIDSLTLGSYRDTTAGIHTPTGYRTRVAGTDGTWGQWSTATPLTAPSNAQRTALPVTPATSQFRYIQIHLTTTKGTLLFLDELEAHTTRTTNTAHSQPVTNLTGCPASGGGCNTTARNNTQLQTLTADTPITTAWNIPTSPWALTSTTNELDKGWEGRGVTYEVDLGGPTPITEITATWLEDYNSSLMLPSDILFQYRDDTGAWKTFGTRAGQVSLPQEIPRTAVTWTYRATVSDPVTTNAIRVQARNGSLKPEGAKTATAGIAQITAHSPG